MNDGFVFGNILGIIVGLWISIGVQDFSTDSYKNQIKKVIEVCEKDLPRNQHCVITGVVEKL